MKPFFIVVLSFVVMITNSCFRPTIDNKSNCLLSKPELKEWIELTDRLALERAKTVTYQDSAAAKEFNLTVDSIVQGRLERLRINEKHNNWKRASNYLGTTPEETESIASSFGFESPYYFSTFLKSYPETNLCRENLISDIRKYAFSITKDSIVYDLSDSEAVTLSFRIHAAERHTH